MLVQKNRTYHLVIGDLQNNGEGFEIRDSLNISFDCDKNSDNSKTASQCRVDIFNLSQEKQKWLEKDFIACVLSIGYVDTGGAKRLFAGQVVHSSTRKSGTDVVTQIQIGGKYTALNHKTVSKLVAPGKNVEDAINELAKEIGADRTVFNSVNIKSPLIDGYPLSGSSREMLDELAYTYNLNWSEDDGVLYITDKGGTYTNDLNTAWVVSRGTGMIDLPYAVQGDVRRSQRDKKRIPGVQVKILANPEIIPGSIVKLEGTSFDGYYCVDSLRTYGEFRGGEWSTELRLEQKIA